MAKCGYNVNTPAAVALVAATVKTALFIVAPAGHGTDLKKFRIGFDGVTASAIPVFWEVNQLTAATNVTPGTGNTTIGSFGSTNYNQVYGRAITGAWTGGYACTSEPTAQTNVDADLLTPNGGLLVYDFPLGDVPDMPASQGFCVRLTAPAAVNVRVSLLFERV